jgi:hypothetical protein
MQQLATAGDRRLAYLTGRDSVSSRSNIAPIASNGAENAPPWHAAIRTDSFRCGYCGSRDLHTRLLGQSRVADFAEGCKCSAIGAARRQADAKATEIYSKAYNQSPEAAEFYEFARTLQAYKSIIGTNTTLVLSTHSDLFKFLEGVSRPLRNRWHFDCRGRKVPGGRSGRRETKLERWRPGPTTVLRSGKRSKRLQYRDPLSRAPFGRIAHLPQDSEADVLPAIPADEACLKSA